MNERHVLVNDAIWFRREKAQSEKRRLLQERSSVLEGFKELCVGHGLFPYPTPKLIPDYDHKAKALRWGLMAGGILATSIFCALNFLSLSMDPAILVMGSLLFAVLIGGIAHGVMVFAAPVDVADPRTCRSAARILPIGGLLAIFSFGLFLYLRFDRSGIATLVFPAIAMTFELATLAFVAAAWELLPLYVWPRRLKKDFDEVNAKITEIDSIIDACQASVGISTLDNVKEPHHEDDENRSSRSNYPGSLPGTPSGQPGKSNGSA